MDAVNIEGVTLTPLKTILHPKGNVFHAMKRSDPGFSGFGEAYFSTVNDGDTKGWKKHLRMTLNLVVPVGRITFVIHDDRDASGTKGGFFEVTLSADNYQRLTVPPGVWVSFMGRGPGLNLLLNLADLEHDPKESVGADLDSFPYDWTGQCKR